MVSNIRFASFKKINIQQHSSFKILITIIILSSFLYLYPIWFLAITLGGYIAYGIIRAILTLIKRKKIYAN